MISPFIARVTFGSGLLFFICAACGSSPIKNLPQHEQDAVGDCVPMIRAKSCADSHSDMVSSLCIREFMDRHGEITTRKGREQHLIDMGCPEGIARGKKY